jgi:hypothetical protein
VLTVRSSGLPTVLLGAWLLTWHFMSPLAVVIPFFTGAGLRLGDVEASVMRWLAASPCPSMQWDRSQQDRSAEPAQPATPMAETLKFRQDKTAPGSAIQAARFP